MLLMLNMKSAGFKAKGHDNTMSALEYETLFRKDMEEMQHLLECLKDELVKLYDGDEEEALDDLGKYVFSDPFYEITNRCQTDAPNPEFDMGSLDIN